MYQRTVLIVEDEILIRMALADSLADKGYDVLEANDAHEAIAALGHHTVDAVITDIDMPGSVNGLDLARMVAATSHGPAVIIASGGHRLSQADIPEGARFVQKPYGFNAMASMVGAMTSGVVRRACAGTL
jgi:DNA-binding NtrC family response regulator